MKRTRFTWLQTLTHLAAWVPLVVLVYDYQSGGLGVNPIQAATQRTGNIALILLVLSLACTPLNTVFRLPALLKLRRPLGLYGYMYAAIHLTIFTGLDYGFDVGLIVQEIVQKRFILVGMTAFLLLTALAATSFDRSKVLLRKNWKRLHRLVYLVNLLVVLHFAWAVKGDVLLLQGDVLRPLLAGLIIVLLLIARLPAVRKRIAGVGAGLKPRPRPQPSPTPDIKAREG
jgi:methionine sulfoxide reductase heme-binding subunit